MFSGIVEGMGEVQKIEESGSNKVFWVKSPFQEALHVDQSLAHDGVCLTVEEVNDEIYRVTAVLETLNKTSLGHVQVGSLVNLERSLTLGSFVDGHLVQGHVDNIATCKNKWEADGSWFFQFQFDPSFNSLLVEKGSITINGISLTAFDVAEDHFTVAIIPYTYEHTNLQKVEAGTMVNLEFDLIGKYVQKQWASYQMSIS
jgi:riboflavin synthase